jgi:hypothetical protein
MKRKVLLILFIIAQAFPLLSQESLLKGIEDSLPVQEKTFAAFKSTRVINAHSMEMLAAGNMDFRILHRFGRLNNGIKELFGLDEASMRMGFDFGITDHLMVGIGRSTHRKELDGFAKIRIMHQAKGARPVPFSLLVAAGAIAWTESAPTGIKTDLADRSSYYIQLIAGRKFSDRFSLQLSPVWLHRNRINDKREEDNSFFAMGAGARYKISRMVAFTVDYHHPFGKLPGSHVDPLSVGVDVETGGHVFQLHFSNTIGMNERAYLVETTQSFFKGNIRFGFNLSRIFKLGRKQTPG